MGDRKFSTLQNIANEANQVSIGGFKNEWELGYEDAIRANERERAARIARRIGLDMMEPSTGESIADAILDPNEN